MNKSMFNSVKFLYENRTKNFYVSSVSYSVVYQVTSLNETSDDLDTSG